MQFRRSTYRNAVAHVGEVGVGGAFGTSQRSDVTEMELSDLAAHVKANNRVWPATTRHVVRRAQRRLTRSTFGRLAEVLENFLDHLCHPAALAAGFEPVQKRPR